MACSPNRLTRAKLNISSNFFTPSNPHKRGSGILKITSSLLFFGVMCIFLALLLQIQVSLPQITNSSSPPFSLPLQTERRVFSDSRPYDQCCVLKYPHTSPLLLIAQSMDIHPNPGPTAIHILRDFTNSEQRKLFNKAKRLQLKLTRYEHHESNYIYCYDHKIIPKGLLIKCRPSIDSACHEQFHHQWTRLLTSTSHKLIKLLRTECQKNLRLLRSEFKDTLDELKSTCSSSTFRQIKHFLRDFAAELFRELQARQRRKLYSAGECASPTSACTRHNNSNQLYRSRNLEQSTVNLRHSPVTTSANHVHVQPTHDPVITAINHPSPTHKHRRRHKRKSTTNRYWRRDNHNIQLDTNAVINLSTVTLTHDETQLLARGLSFCPAPRNTDWTEVRADFNEFSRRMRLLEYFHDHPPQTNPNPFRPKSTWTPPPCRDAALDTFLDAVEHDLLNVTPAPVRDNLTARERNACKLLSRRSDIVIKSADKGSGTVVMDREWYIKNVYDNSTMPNSTKH